MSYDRRNDRRPAYEKESGTESQRSRQSYVYGNTVRKVQPEGRGSRQNNAERRSAQRTQPEGRGNRQNNAERRSVQRTQPEGRGNRQNYVSGNAVRKSEVRRRPEEAPVRQVQPAVRKNREKARRMSAGYVIFLAAAMCAVAFILVNYVQLQAELTSRIRQVSTKESELNSLKSENDEEYNRIINSINLEEIKRIAIGDLGMIYAQEGQIVPYSNKNNDYMRQVPGSN